MPKFILSQIKTIILIWNKLSTIFNIDDVNLSKYVKYVEYNL